MDVGTGVNKTQLLRSGTHLLTCCLRLLKGTLTLQLGWSQCTSKPARIFEMAGMAGLMSVQNLNCCEQTGHNGWGLVEVDRRLSYRYHK